MLRGVTDNGIPTPLTTHRAANDQPPTPLLPAVFTTIGSLHAALPRPCAEPQWTTRVSCRGAVGVEVRWRLGGGWMCRLTGQVETCTPTMTPGSQFNTDSDDDNQVAPRLGALRYNFRGGDGRAPASHYPLGQYTQHANIFRGGLAGRYWRCDHSTKRILW